MTKEDAAAAYETVLRETLDKLAKAVAALELVHDYGTTCNSRGDVAIPGEYWDRAASVLKELKPSI